ncbi:nucleotidyltransferase family protein [Anaerococcus sp. Marseille-Q5996]|uniref:tRNA(Met) cytidine acetate ligase n=1 Tax=Anaerococcus sp. Marseille-Q5996 TaxID=2972769 RepID=UPI0021C5F26E|nr:nucleotidyltransferase family protein [Anaerococcus sp. Marseille-Q5996]
MKTLAIISEFNPFHMGHKYLLDEAKKQTNAELSLSIMSGDYVQRGEPAIIDKFSRADSAMKAGFDMVVEMPSFISLQSAEYFAIGSIKILEKIGIDYLSFGIEKLNPDEFLEKVDILIEKSYELEELTKNNLHNSSFTKARYDSTCQLLGENNFITSNNILALEYIRAIRKIDSKIKPVPIKRISSLNKESELKKENISSSTAIRKNIFNDYKDHVPNFSYEVIEESIQKFGIPSMDYEYEIFKYLLLIEQKPMDNILCYEDGIENYLRKIALKNQNFSSFIEEATTKRYTSSRIKRLMLNFILENDSYMNDYDIDFYKVLAFNKKSEYIFRNSKSMPVLTKKDMDRLTGTDKKVLTQMLKASNLYNISTGRDLNQDFTKKIRRY